ncbi:Tad domain-containing protein [Vibrio nigripulchritudo]|uniref:Tad domain-containing protein n=1 Tax=Vibrio nigripulchritudo TaxID=28173 RepID=UPI002491102B|nr:Tad domain-containing protein [Vibrio nigripulchritudo]BDU36853.1 pilus assembly protein FlpL [Vibrio nigripulchritudo]BDU42563.1 pilus assembly protein FlpL [Vibrio nigripulchritudo]
MKIKISERLAPKHESGNVTIVMLGSLTLILIMFFVAISTIRYTTLKTRMQHASDGALTLIAREGPALKQNEAQYLTKTFVAYNLPYGIRNESLKRVSQVNLQFSEISFDSHLWIKLSQTTQPFLSFLPELKATVESRIERRFSPHETVITLDASRSMSGEGKGGEKASIKMKSILEDFVRTVMAEQEFSHDYNLGFVPYSGYVNLGRDYQDLLITATSRKIPEELREVAQEFGYDHDFLHKAGVEGKRKGACVNRQRYNIHRPETLLRVPSSAANAFDLRVHTSSNGVEYVDPKEINDANLGLVPKPLLPFKQEYKGKAIGTAGDCASMPLTPLTSDSARLEDRISMYYATHNTGGDAGIAWAWRLLSPEWEGIWEKPGYEREVLTDPIQQIIFFTDGENNEGLQDQEFDIFLTNVCKNFADKGIKMHAVLFDRGITEQEKNVYKRCTKMTGGRFQYVKGNNLAKLELYFARLAIRQYKIKHL